jgi:hypothetical protein
VLALGLFVADVTVGGYVEAFYQWHAQNPETRVTNLRGFDARSRMFTLSNVALDVTGKTGPVTVRVIGQAGLTPQIYYAAEPEDGASNWQHVQQATLAVALPHELTVEAGLFPSPIGPEVFAVKDNWNFSRSNLFYGLPFYHTGARVSRPLGRGLTATLAVYNGWNSVVDNNDTPSVSASLSYASPRTTAQLLYFGGIEREERWRHLADAYVQHAVTDRVSLMAQVNAGAEPDNTWLAGALYAKVALSACLYAAVRADAFFEDGDIFWPTAWLASGTATLAYQPSDHVSLRLEARHDQADDDAFYGGTGDVLDRAAQDTVTAGATAWF